MDLKKIGSIVSIIAVWLLCGCIGFAVDQNSKTMFFVWLGIFAVIFAVAYIYEARRSREYTAETPKGVKILKKTISVVLLILAVLTPIFMFKGIGFSKGVYVMMSGMSAVLIVVGGVAVNILNSTRGKNIGLTIIGYLLLIVISLVPGFAMMQYDNSYNALGMAYYSAVAIAVLAWLGSSIFISAKE